MANRHARASRENGQLPAAVTAEKSTSAAASQLDSGRASRFIEPERRRAMIEEAAYYRAERRGFQPGHEIDDWCAAETEIDAFLTRGQTPVLVDS